MRERGHRFRATAKRFRLVLSAFARYRHSCTLACSRTRWSPPDPCCWIWNSGLSRRSVLAVDDSAPAAGPRVWHPHAAGCGQAAALQPRRGRGVARPGRCPEALAGCSQAGAMLLVFVPLGTVPGRASRISLPKLRVRCRCSAALDQPGRFSRLVFQVLPGRGGRPEL